MIEVLKQALEALETEVSIDWTNNDEFNASAEKMHDAITSLRKAIAELESQGKTMKVEGPLHVVCQCDKCKTESQEPVAYYRPHKGFYWAKPTSISAPTTVDVEPLPLYTHPPAAQPEQEPVAWKLMPRDATDAMLKAMDECSTEGYDERLYAGHAASVYMAAWDALLETIPKKKWVGLTEEEHTQIAIDAGCMSADWVFYGAALERKLREKNT